MMVNNDIRTYINVINESTSNNQEKLDEEGGMIDKLLSKAGSRSAKGRVALQHYFKELKGNWQEYASEIGLDRNVIMSQNSFPVDEFVDFLKTQENFDDEMVKAVDELKDRRSNVQSILKSAAKVLAKKKIGAKLTRRKEEPKADQTQPQDQDQESSKTPLSDVLKKADNNYALDDSTATYFKAVKGDLNRAIETAKRAVGDPKKIGKLDHLQRAGLAYLAARGHLKK